MDIFEPRWNEEKAKENNVEEWVWYAALNCSCDGKEEYRLHFD